MLHEVGCMCVRGITHLCILNRVSGLVKYGAGSRLADVEGDEDEGLL